MGVEAAPAAALAQQLRAAGLRVQLYGENKKFKQKMAYADKLGVAYAVLLGTDEMEAGKCSVKNMKTGEQITVSPAEAAAHILENLSSTGPIILEK
jgi:histidyl-tRNA synthetase